MNALTRPFTLDRQSPTVEPPACQRDQHGAPRTIGTLICSYRRPDSLLRGLAALRAQRRAPDEVVVVVRAEDQATAAALAARPDDGLPLRLVTVSQGGTVHALNAGLDASRSDVVAITDDDTAPWPDWLERILAHFQADPAVGGVGGRDWMHEGGQRDEREAEPVGKVQWFGRVIGNHHLGFGPPRPVSVLKGANMSYRAEAIRGIRFDRRLRGTGAQPAEDMTFSLTVARAGWTLIYDPLVAVEHYTAARDEPRHYSGIVRDLDVPGFMVYAHNEAVALLNGLPSWPRRVAFVLFSLLVGTKVAPGLLQAVLLTRRLGLASWRRFLLMQRGKAAGVRTVLTQPRW